MRPRLKFKRVDHLFQEVILKLEITVIISWAMTSFKCVKRTKIKEKPSLIRQDLQWTLLLVKKLKTQHQGATNQRSLRLPSLWFNPRVLTKTQLSLKLKKRLEIKCFKIKLGWGKASFNQWLKSNQKITWMILRKIKLTQLLKANSFWRRRREMRWFPNKLRKDLS